MTTEISNTSRIQTWAWTVLRWFVAFWFSSGSITIAGHALFGWPFPKVNHDAQAFIDALSASRFLYPLLSVVYLVGGGALFFRRTTPLALVILAPPVAIITLFHIVLTGWVVVGVLVALIWGSLVLHERRRFSSLWQMG